MAPERYKYREHRRKAKGHFVQRWKKRIDDKPPNIETLCEEFRNQMAGKGRNILEFLHPVQYHSSRWKAVTGEGVEVIITFNHHLNVPTTVWVNPQQEDKSEPT